LSTAGRVRESTDNHILLGSPASKIYNIGNGCGVEKIIINTRQQQSVFFSEKVFLKQNTNY